MWLLCVCVYSNSRNDVPRVAQWYETIAAHTRHRASLLVVHIVFCVHKYDFAGLIRQTPPPMFSDTAITDRHSDTSIFQLRAHWVQISWSIGWEKSFEHVPPGWSRTLDFLCARRTPYPLGQALLYVAVVDKFKFLLLRNKNVYLERQNIKLLYYWTLSYIFSFSCLNLGAGREWRINLGVKFWQFRQ